MNVLRVMCILLLDRECRRLLNEQATKAVDTLLSLLAAHRDALQESSEVLVIFFPFLLLWKTKADSLINANKKN